ncbi:hypothetical protein [Caballeronia sp. M1242]|uniref:hypothetical protein n=1 Tax=Caballeronia sp. M1242 TaxID=2814653 RepID=UPI0019D0EA88|nr:hypothetical protein [Caballeronia sp. M1242]QSN64546.1 hypothetical protein JYK05_21025 [Caballeronia sp. M1242]
MLAAVCEKHATQAVDIALLPKKPYASAISRAGATPSIERRNSVTYAQVSISVKEDCLNAQETTRPKRACVAVHALYEQLEETAVL